MDITTPDPEATGRELSAALGWECLRDPDGNRGPPTSHGARLGRHWMAGLRTLTASEHPPGTPPHISYYVRVDDADEVHRRALDAGATPMRPPSGVGDRGVLATVVDPFDAAVSFWQPMTFPGWSHPPTAGTPRRMLHSSITPTAAAHFYRERLGLPLAGAAFRARDATPPGWVVVIQMSERPAALCTPMRLPSGHVLLCA